MQEQSSLKTHFDIVIALMIKELQVRFGSKRLGYLWLFLEPILHLIPFYFMRKIFTNVKDVDVIIFLVTGVVAVLFFTKSVIKLQASILANQALFAYRQVKPFDVAIARLLIECIISVGVFVLMMFVFALYFQQMPRMRIFPLAIFTIVLYAILTFAFGVILMVLTVRIPVLEAISPHVVRVIYFASGAFFSVGDLPYSIRPLALLNPIVHVVEILRFNLLPTQMTNHGNVFYVLFFTIIALFVAFFLYFVNKAKLV